MDGIDAALLDTDGECFISELGNAKLVYTKETKYLLKAAERAIKNAQADMDLAGLNYINELNSYLSLECGLSPTKVCEEIKSLTSFLQEQNKNTNTLSLDEVIKHSTILHANVVNKLLIETNYASQAIKVIGYHGQTMYHNPNNRISLQIGDGDLLANITKINVITNFRAADIAAGGQGAPFAPLYHQALARRDNKIPLVMANCGGIANLSIIMDNDIESLIGFDVGPGNGLIDAFVRKRTFGASLMDFNGKYGLAGTVNQAVLDALFVKSIWLNNKNYYLQAIPKSLDIRDIELIPELDALSLEDGCATLEAFTADMIVKSLDLLKYIDIPRSWVLTGGGWKNPVIKQRLITELDKKFFGEFKIIAVDEMGWNGEAMEAQIFSYLAVRSLKNMPLSVQGTTGVLKPTSGGNLYSYVA